MRFQSLDLNLLMALDRLFKDRSVSVAARHLHLSQSAMSHALNRLRDHFGDDLLRVSGRKLVLTPLARALVAPLHDALLRIEAVVGHVPVFDPMTTQRHFTIMASDYSLTVKLAAATGHVRKQAPGITVDFTSPAVLRRRPCGRQVCRAE